MPFLYNPNTLLIEKLHDASPLRREESPEGLRARGPGVPPNLEFACCEQDVEQMQGLFAQTGLLGLLKSLRATVAIPTRHANGT
jgi:hypothetical protein